MGKEEKDLIVLPCFVQASKNENIAVKGEDLESRTQRWLWKRRLREDGTDYPYWKGQEVTALLYPKNN